jgi:putative hydrolase of the HAD superfamily
MSLQQFKVLTFDVVGTLIDFERGMLDYLRSAVPQSDVSDDAFLAAYRQARKRPGTLAYPDDLEPVWHVIAPQLGAARHARAGARLSRFGVRVAGIP